MLCHGWQSKSQCTWMCICDGNIRNHTINEDNLKSLNSQTHTQPGYPVRLLPETNVSRETKTKYPFNEYIYKHLFNYRKKIK